MTLNDIGKMLKLAKVPRSKTVECLFPNPWITIHVPPAHFIVICEVRKHVIATTAAPAPMTSLTQPFDEAKARAGEPIQVMYENKWYDGAVYIGRDPKRGQVINCGALMPTPKFALSYWSEDKMRMAPKQPQTVQMFANVYKAGNEWQGSLVDTYAKALVLSNDRYAVTAFPVTITVAK